MAKVDMLPIRIKIADREFAMTVGVEEEAMIRNSGKTINEKLREFREEYKIDDKQSLLSMYAIDATTQKTIVESSQERILETINQKIDTLEDLLDTVL